MNLSLLDPAFLAQDCPDALIGTLHSGHATCMRFNKTGDYLASGRLDGTVVIFDIETTGVARKLRGHTRQVQSVSWSADGRYLLSASQDWKCILWDLRDGSRVATVRFEAAIFIAELHPQNHLLFVAALFDDAPVLVDISTSPVTKRTLSSTPKTLSPNEDLANGENGESTGKKEAKQSTTVTIFSASGDYILAGTSKGWLNIISSATCTTLFSTRLTNSLITLLRLSPSGREMVVNASDKTIRTFHLPNLTQSSKHPAADEAEMNDGDKADEQLFSNLRIDTEHRFQDIVNHLAWNHVTFSSSPTLGNYVVASIYMNHSLYIWERAQGSLEQILVGPKEELSVVEWHPSRASIAAIGIDSGWIYIWGVATPQRWSALAPDFAEVEENVEYVERVDEFDIWDEEERKEAILNAEDEDVDVLEVGPVKHDGIGADAAGIQFQMPVILGIEESDSEEEMVAVGTGQFRRKDPGQGKEWMVEDGVAVEG